MPWRQSASSRRRPTAGSAVKRRLALQLGRGRLRLRAPPAAEPRCAPWPPWMPRVSITTGIFLPSPSSTSAWRSLAMISSGRNLRVRVDRFQGRWFRIKRRFHPCSSLSPTCCCVACSASSVAAVESLTVRSSWQSCAAKRAGRVLAPRPLVQGGHEPRLEDGSHRVFLLFVLRGRPAKEAHRWPTPEWQ